VAPICATSSAGNTSRRLLALLAAKAEALPQTLRLLLLLHAACRWRWALTACLSVVERLPMVVRELGQAVLSGVLGAVYWPPRQKLPLSQSTQVSVVA
jgi:hypothetical protein